MNAPKVIELKPIKESTEDYEAIEKELRELFKREIYFPLLKELGMTKKSLQNSMDDLLSAIQSGSITFNRGTFSGKFNASITKELKRLGATWDRKSSTFKIPSADLPIEVKNAVSASEAKFLEKLSRIDKKLESIATSTFGSKEMIATKLDISKQFSSAIWKVEKDFKSSVNGITIAPKLSPNQVKRISDEWSNNMQLWVQDFTAKEIKELRQDVAKSAMAGNRYGAAIKSIQDSYGVSANKAKFLARQETSLLMTKFKQTRYEEAGVNEYKWGCVTGTPKHPVRPMHKALEGKIYKWSEPPVVDEKGNRKNPGQDYNCRCFARPIVKFK